MLHNKQITSLFIIDIDAIGLHMAYGKNTTISVTVKTRNLIKAEAVKSGLTQSEYVNHLVTEQQRISKLKKNQRAKLRLEDMTYDEAIAFISNNLETLSNKDDAGRIISFIRNQEKLFLAPMRDDILVLKEMFVQIVTALQQI